MSLILNSILLIILINICIIFEEFTQHILSVLLLQKNIYFVIYMIKLGIEFNYEIYTYIYMLGMPVIYRTVMIIIMIINSFAMLLQIHPSQNSLTLSCHKVMRIVSRRLADDVKLDCVRWSWTCIYDAFITFSLHNNINLCHMIILDKCCYIMYVQHMTWNYFTIIINAKIINIEISLLESIFHFDA